MLIVVAIIGVLTAIAIPVFNSQLEKSRDATDQANIRSAYAELSAALITSEDLDGALAELTNGSFTWAKDGTTGLKATIDGNTTNDAWNNISDGVYQIGHITVAAKKDFTTATFTIDGTNQITGITLS